MATKTKREDAKKLALTIRSLTEKGLSDANISRLVGLQSAAAVRRLRGSLPIAPQAD